MPLRYVRDDAERRIIAVGEGSFRVEDVLEFFARLRIDGAWSYGAIHDVRQMTGQPSLSELRRVLEAARDSSREEQPGPIAVLATGPLYQAACTYAALGPPGPVEVFRDRAEAETWLTKLRS